MRDSAGDASSVRPSTQENVSGVFADGGRVRAVPHVERWRPQPGAGMADDADAGVLQVLVEPLVASCRARAVGSGPPSPRCAQPGAARPSSSSWRTTPRARGRRRRGGRRPALVARRADHPPAEHLHRTSTTRRRADGEARPMVVALAHARPWGCARAAVAVTLQQGAGGRPGDDGLLRVSTSAIGSSSALANCGDGDQRGENAKAPWMPRSGPPWSAPAGRCRGCRRRNDAPTPARSSARTRCSRARGRRGRTPACTGAPRSGRRARGASSARPTLGSARGVKFSTARRRARPGAGPGHAALRHREVDGDRPASGLVPWKVGPYSIQSASVGGASSRSACRRAGRGDSIFTTSAPRVASRWVAAGPAQNAVRSTTHAVGADRASGSAASSGRSP